MEGVVTLKCFTCGKEESVLIDGNITMAVDLMNVTRNTSFGTVLDMNKGRTLVFCSEECRCKSLTKKGTYKVKCGYK